MHVIGRISVIVAACLFACFVGSGILDFFGQFGEWLRPRPELPQHFAPSRVLAFLVASLPFAFLVTFVGEMRKINSLRFYLLSGIIIPVVISLSFRLVAMGFDTFLYFLHMPAYWLSMSARFAQLAISGGIAGSIYWLIAERNAGRWRLAENA
jgi:hypothetical protein